MGTQFCFSHSQFICSVALRSFYPFFFLSNKKCKLVIKAVYGQAKSLCTIPTGVSDYVTFPDTILF
jgi:hypothetical protein